MHSTQAAGLGVELFNIAGKQQWGLNRDFFNEINSELLRAVCHIPQDTKHLYLYKIKGAFTQSNFIFQHQRDALEGLLEGGTLQQMWGMPKLLYIKDSLLSQEFYLWLSLARIYRALFFKSQDYGESETRG